MGNSHQPAVTVLMPVYNGEKYLRQAVESVLRQTWRDFELLVVDDGSSDRSVDLVKSFGDARIRIIRNERNCGLVASLNRGIDEASGLYIARMDSDDISLPSRLARQIDFMKAHKAVGICGTWVKTLGRLVCRVFRYPTSSEQIKAGLFFQNVIGHPSVMMRTDWIRGHGLYYDSSFLHVEDWDLWQRAAALFDLANIPDPQVRYRLHAESVSATKRTEQMGSIRMMCRRNLGKLGVGFDDRDVAIYFATITHDFPRESAFFEKAESWFHGILEANYDKRTYDHGAFSAVLTDRWIWTCLLCGETREEAWKLFHRSSFTMKLQLNITQRLQFYSLLALQWGKARPLIKRTLARYFA
jgi:glycosyltransferase involved in cell wall biosynthesis